MSIKQTNVIVRELQMKAEILRLQEENLTLQEMLKRLKEEYRLSDIWADEEQGDMWDKL
jgi:hypothetical protein